MHPPSHRPSRSGADLAALLGSVPRQARADDRPPSNLGDVLSRSIPKTLQEVLAESLGADPNAQASTEPDKQEPEIDFHHTPERSEPFKLDYPPLPPLPELLDSIRKWAAPLALTPGSRTRDIEHE